MSTVVSAQELTQVRLCRTPDCTNELTANDPTRGRYANLCRVCRTGGGVVRFMPDGPPLAPEPASLEQKAKAMVPLARDVERTVRTSKDSRAKAMSAIDLFSAALTDLRNSVRDLINEPTGESNPRRQ